MNLRVILINMLSKDSSSSVDSIGIGSIAAFLRQNSVNVDLFYLSPETATSEYIEENIIDYDIYGFTLFCESAFYVYETAKIIKTLNKKATIFVGGYLATDAADLILKDCDFIDYIVLGPGEYPIFEMIDCIKKGKNVSSISSVRTRNDLFPKKIAEVDVCSLPFPARDNLTHSLKKGELTARISTSRGCCANCSFCSVNSQYKRWCGRDEKSILNEIINIYENFKVKNIMFVDSSFEDPGILGKERIYKLCKLLEVYPIKFSFRCFLRAETFSNDDISLIKEMKSAGFSQVFIGIEAANEADLKFYHKKASVTDNNRAMRLFADNGIDVVIGFIMLNPYSTAETLKENYLFLKENKIHTIGHYISKMAIFYNSKAYKNLLESGLLKNEYTYLTPYNYNFKNLWAEEVNYFIANIIGDTVLYDEGFLALVNIYINLSVIYPEESFDYISKFNLIKDEIAFIISEYFKLIYVDRNLHRAENQFKEFIDSYLKIYKKAKFLTYQLIKDKKFSEFFYFLNINI